jgi:hypothetical protein
MGRGSRAIVVFAFAVLLTLPVRAARAGEWDGVAFPQATPAGVMAWFVLPTRLVPDDADLPSLPAEGSSPPPYQLHAGRNEYECAQLAVMLAKPVRQTYVEFVGDFSGATWKANKVGEVAGIWPRRADPPLTTSWKYTGTTSTRIPDPLLPGTTFDLDAGLNRIWLTVHIPADAKPGDYHGAVRIRVAAPAAEGKVLLEVPLALRIWNHVLPAESSVLVLADVRPGERTTWEQLRPYYDDLRAHRINATGEILSAPLWRRDQPPPDMTAYEAALKHVLDELHFARFRFPDLESIGGGGSWSGTKVFDAARPEQLARADGAVWIAGSSFTESEPAEWARGGGATLAAYNEKSAAWVEFEFNSAFPAGDPVSVYLQVQPREPKERKIVSLDGHELGTLLGSDFAAAAADSLCFARVPQAVKLTPGKHRLRIDVDDVTGSATAPLYGIYLTSAQEPDLEQLVRDAAALSPAFKEACTYHAQQTAEWLRQRGWLKKSQARPWAREPRGVEYGHVANAYDFLGDVLPSVRRELASPPRLTLRKSVEVWSPSLNAEPFEPDRWHDAIKPTDELWGSYRALQTLGYPPIAMRLIPWIVARHGLDGYDVGIVNGELIYADARTGAPVDSVRWEMLREGLEDFETFRLLRTAVDQAPAGASSLTDAHRLLDEELPAFVKDARDFSWDCAAVESLRSRAGDLLSGLTPAAQ